VATLREMAHGVLAKSGEPSGVSVEQTAAYVGGGALPERSIASVGLVFSTQYDAAKLLARLRAMKPPVIGRVENDQLILDLKAVDLSDLQYLARAVKKAVG